MKQLSNQRQTEVVENSLFEHLLRLTPGEAFFLQYLIDGVTSSVMWIQNQKFTLAQFPRVVDTDNAIGILPSPIHDWTAYFLEMFSKHLAVFDDILAIGNVHYSAIEIGELFDHPRNFSGSDPLPAISEFIFAREVDSIDGFLNFSDAQHLGQVAVALDVEPGEKSLQGTIGTTPTVVIEGLISVMVVFVNAFGEVLRVHAFGGSFDEDVRVVDFLRSVADVQYLRTIFCQQTISSFVYNIIERLFTNFLNSQVNQFASWAEGSGQGLYLKRWILHVGYFYLKLDLKGYGVNECIGMFPVFIVINLVC